jgi:serine protein kinase
MNRITDLVKQSKDKLNEQKQALSWNGTIEEYIEKVIENPQIAASSHKRIDNMLQEAGIDWVDREDGNGKRPHYKFFEEELYGIEDCIDKIGEYFNSAGQKLPVRKRLLMLMGPPGSGKSTMVSLLKKGLEEYTKNGKGEIYKIKGCPMNDDPLTLLPNDIRKVLIEDHEIYTEGTPCPVCTHKLEHEYDGDWTKFEVERFTFSEQLRRGIGTFMPSDPKTQDVAELVGSVNLSKIAEYGDEADPRAYDFNGELNISNRGLVEMIEMLKADEKFLYVLLTLTQEQNIKTPRFPLIFADEIVIAHTNETEWQKFMSKSENEALRDRIITIITPYNLVLSNEVKINQKLLRESSQQNIHIAPHTLEVASMVAIMSRLNEPKSTAVDLLKKMKAYNGEEVEGLRKQEIAEMKGDEEREGMEGLSPRYISNSLSKAITRSKEILKKRVVEDDVDDLYAVKADELKQLKVPLDPLMVLNGLVNDIKEDPKIPKDQIQKYETIIELAKQEYNRLITIDVHKAFVYGFEHEAQEMFQNYIDHAIAYCQKEKIVDTLTGRRLDPDEKLMKSIERHIHVSEAGKNEFRSEILNRLAAFSHRNKQFTYGTHKALKEAIEKEIFERRKDTIHITTNTINPDPDQLEELNRVIKRMVQDLGYDPISANRALKYVARINQQG